LKQIDFKGASGMI